MQGDLEMEAYQASCPAQRCISIKTCSSVFVVDVGLSRQGGRMLHGETRSYTNANMDANASEEENPLPKIIRPIKSLGRYQTSDLMEVQRTVSNAAFC